MSKPVYILQDWSVIIPEQEISPYMAPELIKKKLVGKVYGHPNFEDGKVVVTSRIDHFIDDETVETANSIYKLGKKNLDYQLYLDEYNYFGN